ncbi:MAG: hypothetical protein OEW15_18995, partial [Nitrospirota bacterium]|nr:hypothetical protein [Nitrospirota bacterium]
RARSHDKQHLGILCEGAGPWREDSTVKAECQFNRPDPRRCEIGRMSNSVDEILVRDGGDNYKVYTVANINGSATGVLKDLSSLSPQYVDGVNRIGKMNHSKRSGDIVLIMKDDTDIPKGENIESHRYTTGVACKSWHGSLNRSDSYVPFILTYPGGNKTEIDNVLKKNSVCSSDYNSCTGNWKLSDTVKEIINGQYQ